ESLQRSESSLGRDEGLHSEQLKLRFTAENAEVREGRQELKGAREITPWLFFVANFHDTECRATFFSAIAFTSFIAYGSVRRSRSSALWTRIASARADCSAAAA